VIGLGLARQRRVGWLRCWEGCGSITGHPGFGEVLRGHRHAARL